MYELDPLSENTAFDDPLYDAVSYLDVENEDLDVAKLLKKYDISTHTTYLYHLNDDYHALIEYTSKLIFEQADIPKDIQNELNNNYNLRRYLLIALRDKLDNIFSNNSTRIFKELITIVRLLSFDKKFDIFKTYNYYDMDELGKLFRVYEEKIQKAKEINDEKEFLLIFEQYLLLLDSLIELCTINSSDIQRKKTINPIMETITETINLLKFSVSLEDTYLSILNNLQGKMLFYYSHVSYTNIKDKSAQYLIDEFAFTFERICDGYQLSKDTDFGATCNEKKYYKIFLNSLTTLLSTLLYKLKQTYKEEEFKDLKNFKHIFELYESVITHTEVPKFKVLRDFKMQLLNNYLYLYDETLSSSDDCIIDKFLNDPDFNNKNMYIVYSLVLFSCRIDERRLLRVIYILISMDKFENDYHEFYKLNICDVIINRLSNSQNLAMNNELIDMIVEYIEENKTASHLIATYTKIYLSLSLYFSYLNDEDSIEKSKLYYFYYVNINGTELLDKEYAKMNESIMINHGKKYLINYELENSSYDNEKYINIGKRVLEKFFIREEIHKKFKINQSLSNIITDIFNNHGMDDDLLNSYIEKFISRDIFFGMIFCAIDGLCEKKCAILDLGYEIVEMPLMEGYKLRMAYSSVYKSNFENIFEANKDYIKQNLKNLIISYIKSTPIYLDTITKLPNFDKLRNDLKEENEDLVYIEIYIHNLISLNAKYDYAQTNDVFRNYAQEVNNIVDSYRVSGPKIGFYVKASSDYEAILQRISYISLKHPKEEIPTDLTIAVSFGDKENILTKASHSMSTALKSGKKYFEFK